MNNTLEGINRRGAETEFLELLEDRMVEISATK